MHQLYGIAPGVCGDGDRRDFQTPYDLRNVGTPVANEESWLHQLDPKQNAAAEGNPAVLAVEA